MSADMDEPTLDGTLIPKSARVNARNISLLTVLLAALLLGGHGVFAVLVAAVFGVVTAVTCFTISPRGGVGDWFAGLVGAAHVDLVDALGRNPSARYGLCYYLRA